MIVIVGMAEVEEEVATIVVEANIMDEVVGFNRHNDHQSRSVSFQFAVVTDPGPLMEGFGYHLTTKGKGWNMSGVRLWFCKPSL